MDFKENVILAPYTSFKVGGPAQYLFEATSKESLRAALQQARRNKLAITLLSGGSNVLIADKGIKGLVILMRMRGIERVGGSMDVIAGTSIGELVGYTVREGLRGLAWAGGLPGSVGGAVFGNAGTFGHDMAESITNIEIVHQNSSVEQLTKDSCRFGYRTSMLKEDMPEAAIVSATFSMTKGDKDALSVQMMEAIRWRNEHQPATNTAGSFFRNPPKPDGLDIPPEKISGQGANETIPVGWLIESLGLKHVHIGGAHVSGLHANFLMNGGKASAKDILGLAASIKSSVLAAYDIELQEEVRLLGFE